MSGYQALGSMPHMFDRVAYIKIYLLASSMIFTNGQLNSATVLTRRKSFLQITAFGKGERKVSEWSPLLMP